MEIIGKRIKLRPFIKSDIDDHIRWMTIDTEWMQWDAPWEENDFDIDVFRKASLSSLNKNRPVTIFSTREIEIIDSGEHIGRINCYRIDENYNFSKEGKNLTIGINIYKQVNRKRGYATEAWLIYIKYLLDNGVEDIYTQTWSGNYPVQALMKKIGFELINTNEAYHKVAGKEVDGLTFKLDVDKFLKKLEY